MTLCLNASFEASRSTKPTVEQLAAVALSDSPGKLSPSGIDQLRRSRFMRTHKVSPSTGYVSPKDVSKNIDRPSTLATHPSESAYCPPEADSPGLCLPSQSPVTFHELSSNFGTSMESVNEHVDKNWLDMQNGLEAMTWSSAFFNSMGYESLDT